MERECLRCGHKWYGRQTNRPLNCAKCKSIFWDSDKIHRICKRCGHTWFGKKVGRPIACVKCKSVYWDVPKPVTNSKGNREQTSSRDDVDVPKKDNL